MMTKEQKQYVLDNYSTMPDKDIAANTGLTVDSVHRFAHYHNLEKPDELKWNASTIRIGKYLKDHYADEADCVLAKELGVSIHLVYNYAKRYHLKKSAKGKLRATEERSKRTSLMRRSQGCGLSPEQEQEIIERYPMAHNGDLLDDMGITEGQLRWVMKKYGLKKDSNYIRGYRKQKMKELSILYPRVSTKPKSERKKKATKNKSKEQNSDFIAPVTKKVRRPLDKDFKVDEELLRVIKGEKKYKTIGDECIREKCYCWSFCKPHCPKKCNAVKAW